MLDDYSYHRQHDGARVRNVTPVQGKAEIAQLFVMRTACSVLSPLGILVDDCRYVQAFAMLGRATRQA